MKEETSPEEYWAAMAEEIGEPIRAYALAQLVDISASAPSGMFSPKHEWALVFMTETALYIERGASQNWFARMVTTGRSKETPERKSIAVKSMTRVTIPPPRRGVLRFLASPEVVVQIEYNQTPGSVRLILDRRGRNDMLLIDLLSEAARKNA